jgi:hypothetical protein
MTQIANTFFTRGSNSTIQLARGTNLSYQSTGLAIYTSTEIDTWYIGDFVSAEYIINAEYGLNERETIHATLVAMPGQSSITVYGRTSLTRPLINVRSSATNSHAGLIVEPASSGVQGSIITLFANYAKTSLPVRPMNAPAITGACYWNHAYNATTLTINVPLSTVTGTILVGQRVSNPLLPVNALVKSWTPVSGVPGVGALIITGFLSTTILAGANQQLTFTTSPTQLNNLLNVIQPVRSFSSIIIPGQKTVDATVADDYLNLKAENGIKITSNQHDRSIIIKNQGITQISVPGQSDINPAIKLVTSVAVDLNSSATSSQLGLPRPNQSTTWTLAGGKITLQSSGLPYHSYGNYPTSTFIPINQNYNLTWTLRAGTNQPAAGGFTSLEFGAIGYWLNGVAMYSPKTASGPAGNNPNIYYPQWQYNRSYQSSIDNGYVFGNDLAGGETDPALTGTYNYRDFKFGSAWTNGSGYAAGGTQGGYPTGVGDATLIPYLNGMLQHEDGHSKILGFALDGYPVYGPYGYTIPTDNTSTVKIITSSYLLNTTRTTIINTITGLPTATPPIGTRLEGKYPLGTFVQDYTYVGGGDLDDHNGRYCVTPDYPNGTYAYFTTIDNNLKPTYPYIVGNTFYGFPNTNTIGNGSAPTSISSGSTTLNVVQGDHITLTTKSTTNQLTITADGQTLTTDDAVTKTQTTNIIAGANGITTSQTGTNTLTIRNNVSVYNKLYGDTNPVAGFSSATSIASTFKILGTGASYSGTAGRQAGISTILVSQDATHGDYIQLLNTGVLGLNNGTSVITGTAGNLQPSDIINTVNSQQLVLTSASGAITTNPGLQPGLVISALMYFLSAH